MSHQVYSLWIFLEGHPRPILLDDIIFNLKRDANLSDLAPQLVNRFSKLAQKNNLDLEFFNFDARTESLLLDTTLKAVEQDTLAGKPLVYVLLILALGLRLYSRGQSQIDQYSSRNLPSPHDWSLTPKDVLNEILHNQYSAIEAIPELNIDATFRTDTVLNGQELKRFINNLEKIASAFHYEVSSNEATAHNYINPFMVDAVAKVRLKYPSTQLVVEEDFDGSRGYSRLDYIIYCRDLAILILEAKMIEIQKGIAQILVQLHTAAEFRAASLLQSQASVLAPQDEVKDEVKAEGIDQDNDDEE
ncbi:unnamed protein product [Rhizophagus irregularis]|nr:unnamed protein product [Rhizophagus irregularis]